MILPLHNSFHLQSTSQIWTRYIKSCITAKSENGKAQVFPVTVTLAHSICLIHNKGYVFKTCLIINTVNKTVKGLTEPALYQAAVTIHDKISLLLNLQSLRISGLCYGGSLSPSSSSWNLLKISKKQCSTKPYHNKFFLNMYIMGTSKINYRKFIWYHIKYHIAIKNCIFEDYLKAQGNLCNLLFFLNGHKIIYTLSCQSYKRNNWI